MSQKMQRLFITAKDLQVITGTTLRNCFYKMQHLKDALGKKAHQHITFNEYAEYEGIKVDEIYSIIQK